MFKTIRSSFASVRICKKSNLSNCFYFSKRNLNFQRNEAVSEDEILDALYPDKAPTYSRVPDFISQSQAIKKEPLNVQNKKKNVIISCKNSKLNHYINQKYDKSKIIPLASNGWGHYKSKGDYFTIKVCNDDNYIENLFWDEEICDFNQFRLNPLLIDALKQLHFIRPTKIQIKSIPKLLSGWNSLITAETGCGKTLAYLIPVVNQILEWSKHLPVERELNSPLALILAPSRDLAEQIGEVAVKLSYLLPFRSNVLVGGRTKKKMLYPEYEQVDLQIATLGALTKLVSTGIYNISNVKHVVLDEGDTMLDDSFNELLVRLLKKIKIRYQPSPKSQLPPDNSQISIVSATMPRCIYEILDTIVETDSLHKISTEKTHQILPHVSQTFYRLGFSQKPEKLLQLVKESLQNNETVMIFSNKTKTCDWISLMLNENGIDTMQLNGTMPVVLRRGRFKEFQEGQIKVLSCTDIGSRGLDTVKVRHIIHYEFPKFMADYVHRCGRTGRVGSHSKCHISSFISSDSDVDLVKKIETAVRSMNELPNVNGNISKIIHNRFLKYNMEKNVKITNYININ